MYQRSVVCSCHRRVLKNQLIEKFIMMKKLPFSLVFILFGSQAFANSSHCYSIQNQDLKNFCLATAGGQKSYCYSIGESDTKNLCLAQVGSQKSYCYSIRSQDVKNQCLAIVK
jgi:hypothetical protein